MFCWFYCFPVFLYDYDLEVGMELWHTKRQRSGKTKVEKQKWVLMDIDRYFRHKLDHIIAGVVIAIVCILVSFFLE